MINYISSLFSQIENKQCLKIYKYNFYKKIFLANNTFFPSFFFFWYINIVFFPIIGYQVKLCMFSLPGNDQYQSVILDIATRLLEERKWLQILNILKTLPTSIIQQSVKLQSLHDFTLLCYAADKNTKVLLHDTFIVTLFYKVSRHWWSFFSIPLDCVKEIYISHLFCICQLFKFSSIIS